LIEKLRKDNRLWDLFTRKEEYSPPFLDKYKRFGYYLSNNKNIFEPEVSRFLVNAGLKVEYPGERKFAIALSHDIDCLKVNSARL